MGSNKNPKLRSVSANVPKELRALMDAIRDEFSLSQGDQLTLLYRSGAFAALQKKLRREWAEDAARRAEKIPVRLHMGDYR